MHDKIDSAIDASTTYLLNQQAADGHWEDYSLPVGPSDAWVTAYVGLALGHVTPHTGAAAAPSAAKRAARWLVTNRPYAAGWGYNGRTRPDADSTAHVIALLQATGTSDGGARFSLVASALAAGWRLRDVSKVRRPGDRRMPT